ncbi:MULTISPECIES: NAD-dependent epimerase/dehydratase family protein [unclassified Breznakia]|uniref:NAD-dependent epimerase/dehydratase family protein n=1 Tax=unclassified Breznakia TaxID=2623764 RepID=UPI00247457B4|nr:MULTISPECIES: NAD-dependent epimerase/dehydratase family protein [unclassified Breznakia]MDH6366290.1 nucleoside-diphosphate-sugar epimerase [Breznakia sp. PH1-1]MDH6403383.1 nucleoside-diphosphate-sugar epimerase [Breznakia sp. PF1-11]MDH6411092.1 nucleoside-diphosphate-sugar epimerase [Breznakia sp. PFB1-11]MDH6413456.1 nucleoside-diphosphate-sugar epimerase [Breznakia sp. PFB1-14]MDH6416755.1 nucleoside-diphosphate-sugar epimerase [Breznakia sp. PFB1-4]
MKRILITGKGSYIGTCFKEYMSQYSNDYYTEELDMLDSSWKEFDFGAFDVVFHVAGLAHSTPSEDQRELYYKVNTDLVYEVAEKAKKSGVKQFIFMSSIIVYGSGEVGENRIITSDTPLTPDNFYGDSKKQAEIKINTLRDDSFLVLTLRPPMIYGKHSKGNYERLSKLAKITPFFPKISNRRSMLFIDNLSEFVRLAVDDEFFGVFHPQNEEYVSTSKLVQEIASLNNHKIRLISFFNPIIVLLKKQSSINKLFGNFVIDKSLSLYSKPYCKSGFKQSIKKTEVTS